MQPNRTFRIIIIILFTALTGYLGYKLSDPLLNNRLFGWYQALLNQYPIKGHSEIVRAVVRVLFALLGTLLGYLFSSRVVSQVTRLGQTLGATPPGEKIAMVVGVTIGLAFTALVAFVLFHSLPDNDVLTVLLTLFAFVVLTYISVSVTMSIPAEYWILSHRQDAGPAGPVMQSVKVLDTNVIIDGRIADVCASGFLEGTLYVPGFVLDELQTIADSGDPLKRARGRRGLEILNDMQKATLLVVRDFDDAEDILITDPVDQKLVKLAKHLKGAIITNDFNLNKVAELQGVRVLNLNELANAVKPVVLPGEEMTVQIIKEGKEANQGVGYLEDGTMIVVEGGRRHIGEHLQVVVSSVLQTVAGKMIFTQMREMDDAARSFRPDRPVRARRP